MFFQIFCGHYLSLFTWERVQLIALPQEQGVLQKEQVQLQ